VGTWGEKDCIEAGFNPETLKCSSCDKLASVVADEGEETKGVQTPFIIIIIIIIIIITTTTTIITITIISVFNKFFHLSSCNAI